MPGCDWDQTGEARKRESDNMFGDGLGCREEITHPESISQTLPVLKIKASKAREVVRQYSQILGKLTPLFQHMIQRTLEAQAPEAGNSQ
ncbi:hypothetical protein Plim_1097 [Planctopirus limnophila DSM 3776]|uniref:Uncharacterized protein n=1 Tax=Planctopirus limnophila (strain ATCC 43296 / DSM 3776 / IFAM 1008 / Mu 290) TaxID=521674 RepID=D5STU9_PLAL2|nr:hypothetical protein Plim_1097 [Planctopirus limnophila DSM 3776]